MSFLSGPECSTSANPLRQFTKHVQDDTSLQRDRLVGNRPGGMQEGFRRAMAPGAADVMMDEFMHQPQVMPQPSVSPMAMEQMRREFEALRTGPQQRSSTPNWGAEFDPGTEESARMEGVFQGLKQPSFNPAEFERYVQIRTSHTASPMANTTVARNDWQAPMNFNMGYSGMGYRPTGMQYNQPVYNPPPQQAEVQSNGKSRMVELDDQDWEAQFAELDINQAHDVDEAAEHAVDAELDDIDRSVEYPGIGSEDAFSDFESVWRKIQAETLNDENRAVFDTDMVDDGRWREHLGEGYPEWDNFDGDIDAYLRDPQLGDYLFEENNLFDNVSDPFAEGVRIMDEGGNLSLAALAFEAAVQKHPDHVEAWTRLGAAQAQNEKESPAIRALEQALKLDPTNLEALMSLAVSYTNEGYDTTAYRTLERWLSTKYPSITPDGAKPAQPISDPNKIYTSSDPFSYDLGFTDRQQLHERVTNLFIRAAQLSPSPETMDPDVQVGLGVLFYGAEEFEKAVDCFSAALESNESGMTNSRTANQRPLLWNRLGATLANSGRSEEAIQAYEEALQLNPNFVRARYNLGVSCINIGCYTEAAQHLLGALSMHSVVQKESQETAKELLGGGGGAGGGIDVSDTELENILRQNQSTNLYDTLRRVFGQMGRKDLAEKVVSGVDPEQFRGEFDF